MYLRKGSLRRFGAILLALFVAMTLLPQLKSEAATYSEGKDKTKRTVKLTEGESAGMQFAIKTPITSIGAYVQGSGVNRVLLTEVYKWDENIIKTCESAPVYSASYTEWAAGALVGAEFSTPLEAGEYLLKFTLKEGTSVSFVAWSPASRTRLYLNDYIQPSSLDGMAVAADGSENPFGFVSDPVNRPYHTAEPEYVIKDDDPISVMGVDPTQWVAVDGLGRELPTYEDVGKTKDKKVGIFYWTWHLGQSNGSSKGINVTKLMLEHPELAYDYHNSLWKSYSAGAYFWNEPLFGFYTEADNYVLRKHAELLADAGVDFVLFDCTNGDYTWEDAYLNLCKVWTEAREQGVKTPQISFMMQFGYTENTTSSLKQVYNALYKDGKYQDLWFYWEGKPLLMSYSDGLSEYDDLEMEIKNFFTFRAGRPSYFEGDCSDDYWGWLHVYPQAVYKNADGSVEQVTVGIAQNANADTMELDAMNNPYNMGRSFSMQKNYSYSYKYRGEKITVNSNIENSKLYGINFQEQWDYAISVDPEIIFVTGWNEWIAGRFEHWGSVDCAFPDQYDDENSRDIEPSKGDLKDYYYYQLVANIRRFKGVSKPQAQPDAKTIDINGDVSQWNDSSIITYNHYTKNTYDRDIEKSWGYSYENHTMRNDIKTAKVSYDSDNIYFYVETVDDITPYTDENWMRLLIDTGAATKDSKDWEEFEYILNRTNPTADTMTLEKSTGGWNWETVGTVTYKLSGNVLQVSVPRSYLGLTEGKPVFNFKWCDNNLTDGDIMTLYTDGDSAPGGRFAFAFRTTPVADKKNVNIFVVIACIAAGIAVIAAAATLILVMKKGKKND